MKDLIGIFAAAGCAKVRTFIQSGNVIFEANPAQAKKVPKAATAAIEAAFGFRIPVILRSATELAEVLTNNPFLAAGAPPDALCVVFLKDLPDAAAVARLDPDRSPPDAFAVRGREVYMHLANGFGNSKLTNAWLDSKLSTIGTVRNWRTTVRLFELTRSETSR